MQAHKHAYDVQILIQPLGILALVYVIDHKTTSCQK
jgi:hypothetical protein